MLGEVFFWIGFVGWVVVLAWARWLYPMLLVLLFFPFLQDEIEMAPPPISGHKAFSRGGGSPQRQEFYTPPPFKKKHPPALKGYFQGLFSCFDCVSFGCLWFLVCVCFLSACFFWGVLLGGALLVPLGCLQTLH